MLNTDEMFLKLTTVEAARLQLTAIKAGWSIKTYDSVMDFLPHSYELQIDRDLDYAKARFSSPEYTAKQRKASLAIVKLLLKQGHPWYPDVTVEEHVADLELGLLIDEAVSKAELDLMFPIRKISEKEQEELLAAYNLDEDDTSKPFVRGKFVAEPYKGRDSSSVSDSSSISQKFLKLFK